MPQKSLTTHTRELAPAFNYHIEGFYYAGGVQGLILCITDLLDTGTMTVTGRFKQNPSTARVYNERIFGPGRIHIVRRGTDCALYGNLAPDSAVVKSGAVAPKMLVHGGLARVFDCGGRCRHGTFSSSYQSGRCCRHPL